MSAALPLYALPAIGAPWPGQGGTFRGLLRNAEGATVVLVLADAVPNKRMTWPDAMSWANEQSADGHADFTLPSREEGRLLQATSHESFEHAWHWLSEDAGGSYAWAQSFGDGYQNDFHKLYELRARAVRRFVLQSFDSSKAAAQ